MNENPNITEATEAASEVVAENDEATELYNNRNSISRYKMREQAMLLVFENLFHNSDIDELADNLIDSRDIYLSDHAVEVAKAIVEKQEELDEKISSHLSKGWRISRISKVSLAILRVAVYEIYYSEEAPVSVAINEAVELSKKYTPDDAKFVNGLLGAVAGDLG